MSSSELNDAISHRVLDENLQGTEFAPLHFDEGGATHIEDASDHKTPAEQWREKYLLKNYDWEDFHLDEYCVLSLTQGYFAIISSKQWLRLSGYNWYAEIYTNKRGEIVSIFAARRATKRERKRGAPKKIYLHRYIKGAVRKWQHLVVDHRSGEQLDCRDENLRETNHSGNSGNSTYRKGKWPRGVDPVFTSVEGVRRAKIIGYRGVIMKDRVRRRSRVLFSTPERAHRWYLRMHAVLHDCRDNWHESTVREYALPPRLDAIPF